MKSFFLLVVFCYLANLSCTLFVASKKTPQWVADMETQVEVLEKKFNGEFGVYIKDINSQEEFSHNASEFWYLSSTVKIPVAIAFLKLVDQGKVKFSERVTITKKDYRDGAGPVNWIVPGEKVSYKYLFNKMLKYSDNAATDLIIKKVGLKAIESIVADHADKNQFGEITTLLDVRRKAYSEFHPKAQGLSNFSFFKIKKQKTSQKRLSQLAKELKISREKLKYQKMEEGFSQYYAKTWNSASLMSYGQLLEQLIRGKILSPASTKLLLKTLGAIHTGKKRIRRGLKKKTFFAHKTGTQFRRACDVGIARSREKKKNAVLILVCTRDWKKLSEAEKLMSQVGKIISKTRLL